MESFILVSNTLFVVKHRCQFKQRVFVLVIYGGREAPNGLLPTFLTLTMPIKTCLREYCNILVDLAHEC
jgi:hypothetical protein